MDQHSRKKLLGLTCFLFALNPLLLWVYFTDIQTTVLALRPPLIMCYLAVINCIILLLFLELVKFFPPPREHTHDSHPTKLPNHTQNTLPTEYEKEAPIRKQNKSTPPEKLYHIDPKHILAVYRKPNGTILLIRQHKSGKFIEVDISGDMISETWTGSFNPEKPEEYPGVPMGLLAQFWTDIPSFPLFTNHTETRKTEELASNPDNHIIQGITLPSAQK